ncbi:hypothetical protein PUF88_06040 [Lactobacillaceae bacterium L1_55_11]|nr:hypothetical protein [Lactobacillaceae bacterium L1_55_11]
MTLLIFLAELVPALFLAILIHELAHVIAARALKISLRSLNLAGINYRFKNHHLSFKPNVFNVGGSVVVSGGPQAARSSYLTFILAGPVASLVVGLVLQLVPGSFWAILAWVNLAVAVLTGLPLHHLDNDGYYWRVIRRHPAIWEHRGLVNAVSKALQAPLDATSFDLMPECLNYFKNLPVMDTRSLWVLLGYANAYLLLGNPSAADREVIESFYHTVRDRERHNHGTGFSRRAIGELLTTQILMDQDGLTPRQKRQLASLPKGYQSRLRFLNDPNSGNYADRYRKLLQQYSHEVDPKSLSYQTEQGYLAWSEE